MLSAATWKIYPSSVGMEGCLDWQRERKVIIMKKALMMMAMNSWTLMWCSGGAKEGSWKTGSCRKTAFCRRHWKGRLEQKPPMAVLHASERPLKWWSLGTSKLRGRSQTEAGAFVRSSWRFEMSWEAAALMRTVRKGFHARLRDHWKDSLDGQALVVRFM